MQQKQKNPKKEEESDYITEKEEENEEQANEEEQQIIQITQSLLEKINIKNSLEGIKYNNMILRYWVDNIPCQQVDSKVLTLVNELAYKQAMKKLKEPKKAKKRIVAGFREVLSALKSTNKEKKPKCIIIALNLQQSPLENGTDQLVVQIINLAQSKNIPIVHSSTRTRLGKAFTGKFGPRISVIAILNYEGMNDQFKSFMSDVEIQKQLFIEQYPQN